jgi:hypothetical protein
MYGVSRARQLRCWQATHTNQMSVFVFDDIRQKPFCLTPRSAVQLPYLIQHHKECQAILQVITWRNWGLAKLLPSNLIFEVDA